MIHGAGENESQKRDDGNPENACFDRVSSKVARHSPNREALRHGETAIQNPLLLSKIKRRVEGPTGCRMLLFVVNVRYFRTQKFFARRFLSMEETAR